MFSKSLTAEFFQKFSILKFLHSYTVSTLLGLLLQNINKTNKIDIEALVQKHLVQKLSARYTVAT